MKWVDDNGRVWTEQELRADYEKIKADTDDEFFPETFERYVELAHVRNNGVLEEVAPDEEIENKRRWTAVKLSAMTGYFYDDILNVLRRLDVHGNWTRSEIANRPVDLDELTEIIQEEL